MICTENDTQYFVVHVGVYCVRGVYCLMGVRVDTTRRWDQVPPIPDTGPYTLSHVPDTGPDTFPPPDTGPYVNMFPVIRPIYLWPMNQDDDARPVW